MGLTNPINSRKWKRGGLSVLLTIIFVTAVVLINVIINTLLSRFDVRLDLTEQRLFSIEPSTAEFLNDLDDTIHFYFCSNEEAYRSLSNYFGQVIAIVERFAESNRNFTVSFVDRLSNPVFSAEYGGNLSDSDIVIVSEKTGRYRVVNSSEYMVVSFFYDGQRISQNDALMYRQFGAAVEVDISSGAEQAFLSAIMSVSDLSPVRVAFTEGFGEGVITNRTVMLYEPIEYLLEQNSYIIETVNLITEEAIDPDIDFLIIFAPTLDYSIHAINAVADWLDNDGFHGKNLLYFPAVFDVRDTPNLDSFLAEWGVRIEQGFVVQNNRNFAIAGSNGIDQFVAHGGMFSGGVELPFAGSLIRPVTQLFERDSAFMTSIFLQSYPGTSLLPFEAIDGGLDDEELEQLLLQTDVYNMGIMSMKIRLNNMDEFLSRVITFGSPYFFTPNFLESEHLANAHLLLNIFDSLSGRDDQRAFIIPKSFSHTTFEITAGQADSIAVTFVVIMPVIIIALGIVVFIRRRYK
jgi:hypothetical protein